MAQNLNSGPRQAGRLDLASVNLAMASIWEALDGLLGLRGNAVTQSPITIGGTPSAATDSARLGDLRADPTDPFLWLLGRSV